jgi:LmbE family N-acetylglucosaminyl deacetylase
VTARHDPPRLLLVVAHPDDETFGCGSLLLAAAAAGWRTTVACATRGEAGEPSPTTNLGARSLGDVREAELRSAARLLGVAEVILLGFADSGMEGEPRDGTLAAAGADAVTESVRRVVRAVEPDAVVTLDASDGHRDHAVIRDATVGVALECRMSTYLQCLPRSLMDRWAAHMAEVQPGLAHLRYAELGTPDDQITLTIDTSAQYDGRMRAIAAHASQTSPFDGLPEDLSRAFLTREHLVLVGSSA